MEIPDRFLEQGFLNLGELALGLVNLDAREQHEVLSLIRVSGDRRLVPAVVKYADLFAQGEQWGPVYDALCELGGKLATSSLCRWSRRHSDPWHRLGLVHKLSVMEDERFEILRTLRHIAADRAEYPEIRGHALEGLGYRQVTLDRRGVRFQKTAEVIRDCLVDSEPDVRFWACFAAGQGKDTAALSRLRRLRVDKSRARGFWTVGEEARDAIGLIKGLIEEAPDRENTEVTEPVSWER